MENKVTAKLKKGMKPTYETTHDLIITVITRGFADYVVNAARDAGATGATILYGRGTADADKQVMGISLQPEREAVLILTKKTDRKRIMQEIADKTGLMEEGRGLCFSLPVSKVFGLKRVAEQKEEQLRKARELEKASRQVKAQSKTEQQVEEVSAEPVVEEKAEVEVKAPAKKAPAKKSTAKSTTKKSTSKKTTAKKTVK